LRSLGYCVIQAHLEYDIQRRVYPCITSWKRTDIVQANLSLSALVTPYLAYHTDNLYGVDSSMSSSTDTTNIDKHLSSAPLTYHGRSQSRQMQPAAMQKWLEETPKEEPWSRSIEGSYLHEAQRPMKQQEQTVAHGLLHDIESNRGPSEPCELHPAAIQKLYEETPHEEPWSRTVEKCPCPEVQGPLDQQEQNNVLGLLHDTDGNRSPSAGITNTNEPLPSTQSTSHKQSEPCELDPVPIQNWLQETPYEEPCSTSSRPTKQCSTAEAQGLLEGLDQDMALDTTRR
jgi:hypothetical protein